MSLYKEWSSMANMEMTPEQYQAFWGEYLDVEKGIYQKILQEKNPSISGTVQELADAYEIEPVVYVGFLDGVNSSLKEELTLDDVDATTEISATIDFEKLYYNMHDAKAKWLYKLEEWEDVLDKDIRKDIRKRYMDTVQVINTNKVGRNDPCPCGSGKKYKKCCLNK